MERFLASKNHPIEGKRSVEAGGARHLCRFTSRMSKGPGIFLGLRRIGHRSGINAALRPPSLRPYANGLFFVDSMVGLRELSRVPEIVVPKQQHSLPAPRFG